MTMLNIFDGDAFSVTRLALAMRDIAYRPSRVGQLGIFAAESIDTLDFAIEKQDKDTLALVPSSPRGSPGDTRDFAKRSIRRLSVPHFSRMDGITADEIMQVREFGSETAVEQMAAKIARKAAVHSQDFALTEEFHRLEVIKSGRILDADGVTVLYNFATEFGLSLPAPIFFDLLNASPADGILLEKCAEVMETITAALDGLPFTGIRALCGSNFYKALRKHKEVRETYKYQEGAALRQGFVANGASSAASGVLSMFEFGDITWEWYRGGNTVNIATGDCHFVVEGVPNLFRTVYAPADYIETVNRPGQRLYVRQNPRRDGKGVDLEVQMNALHFCTRPNVLLRGNIAAS